MTKDTMTAEQFASFIRQRTTGALLDRMLEDNQRIDRERAEKKPRPCCGEYAGLGIDTGITQTFTCPVCERVFTAPCRMEDR